MRFHLDSRLVRINHRQFEALARNMTVIAVGHHRSERFAMEHMAEKLHMVLPDLHCWASTVEQDPLCWLPNR